MWSLVWEFLKGVWAKLPRGKATVQIGSRNQSVSLPNNSGFVVYGENHTFNVGSQPSPEGPGDQATTRAQQDTESPAATQEPPAIEVNYSFVESVEWVGPGRAAVTVINKGDSKLHIKYVRLRYVYRDTRVTWELAPNRRGELIPLKPINAEDASPQWRQTFYFLTYVDTAESLAQALKEILNADISTLRLDIWAEEEEYEPIWMDEGEGLIGLLVWVKEQIRAIENGTAW